MKALSLQKFSQAKEAEKKYQVGNRLMGFFVASVHLSIDTTQKLFNAKDREDLILKLPVSMAPQDALFKWGDKQCAVTDSPG